MANDFVCDNAMLGSATVLKKTNERQVFAVLIGCSCGCVVNKCKVRSTRELGTIEGIGKMAKCKNLL
jgi:hypothetical protein